MILQGIQGVTDLFGKLIDPKKHIRDKHKGIFSLLNPFKCLFKGKQKRHIRTCMNLFKTGLNHLLMNSNTRDNQRLGFRVNQSFRTPLDQGNQIVLQVQNTNPFQAQLPQGHQLVQVVGVPQTAITYQDPTPPDTFWIHTQQRQNQQYQHFITLAHSRAVQPLSRIQFHIPFKYRYKQTLFIPFHNQQVVTRLLDHKIQIFNRTDQKLLITQGSYVGKIIQIRSNKNQS